MNTALKERKHSLRRENILAVTQRLMGTRGFSAMTMDDVANSAGISKATLYQHFRSKDDLAVEVVIKAIERLLVFIQALDPTLSPREMLRVVVRRMLTIRFSEVLDFHDAEATLPLLLKQHSDYVEQDKQMIACLVQLIEAVQQEGDIPSDIPALIVAQMMVSCLKDIIFRDLLKENVITFEELENTMLWFVSGKSEAACQS